MTEIRDICFSYGKRRILAGLSFSADKGECVVLAGPNGSGKSTALAVIAGVLRPDSGSVHLDGKLGYVPQGTALFEDMTVADNLAFFAGLAGSTVPETLPFGLQQRIKTPVSKLSGGMKKQLSIACGLLGEPDVILFDEPCASLDVEYRAELSGLILQMKAQGKTIIYVGHEPSEFADFYDKLIFFGEKTECFSRSQLSGEPGSDSHLQSSFTELFRKHKK